MKPQKLFTNHLTRLILPYLILVLLLPGCKYFYEVEKVRHVSTRNIGAYRAMGKYFILHRSDSAWQLTIQSTDSGLISGTLAKLPTDHLKYLTTNPEKGNNRYRKHKDNEIAVLQEVHLYVSDSLTPGFAEGDRIRLHPSVILRTEVYQQNRERTTASWVIPAIAVPVGLAAILVVIAVVGKGSMSINVSH